jgi:HEAT repeat protein
VVAGCVGLIEGDDADGELILALGGPPARRLLGGGSRSDQRYWFRVWGTRGLLWAWDDTALDAVLLALRDPAWRVREMAAKVSARHRVGEALPALVELRADPVPRVRAAAARAVVVLTHAGA